MDRAIWTTQCINDCIQCYEIYKECPFFIHSPNGYYTDAAEPKKYYIIKKKGHKFKVIYAEICAIITKNFSNNQQASDV